MTQVVGGFEALRASMSGPVIGPGDAGYDEARKVHNAGIDRRPTVIAQCLDAGDVTAAVRFAGAEGLGLTVRAGAHGVSGSCIADGRVMIDLSRMRHVRVDPGTRRARVGGGALLADLDAATQEHGLAAPAGLISHTGVAGLTLGGGMGWLTRKHGLSIDNLVSAEVVGGDGEVRRASESEHPDLFWAIRGGGGSFGVVTELELALHPVGPTVRFGLFFFALDQGAEALRLARDLMADLPAELTAIVGSFNAPPAPFVPGEHQLAPGWAIMLTGFGPVAEHDRAADRIRESLPPLWEIVTPMPYTQLQQLVDDGPAAWGNHDYEKGTYVEELSDAVIAVMTEHLPRKTSPMTLMLCYPLDGAYSAVPEAATAFGGGRSPRLQVFIVGVTMSSETLPAERDWVRSFWDAMRPVSLAGAYVNGLTERDEALLRAAYGDKYARLAGIKAAYDPGNVFDRGLAVRPAV